MIISKINKMEVSETSEAKKYSFVVKNNVGKLVKVEAIQINGESEVEVIKVKPYVLTPSEQTTVQ